MVRFVTLGNEPLSLEHGVLIPLWVGKHWVGVLADARMLVNKGESCGAAVMSL